MSDEIIAKAIAQIAEHESAAALHNSEVARLKSFVNTYDQFAGREPRFGDLTVLAAAPIAPAATVSAVATPTRGWSAGDFLGKPFATAVKMIMQARHDLAGKPAPAAVDEIHETLLQGTFDFGTNNSEQQKQGIRISLGKNTATFVRLPNSDLFGLNEWYPGVKRTVRPRVRLTDDERERSAAEIDGAEEETEVTPSAVRVPAEANGSGGAAGGTGSSAQAADATTPPAPSLHWKRRRVDLGRIMSGTDAAEPDEIERRG